MKELKLTNTNEVAYLDDEDYENLSKYKWHLTFNRYKKPSSIRSKHGLALHRVIMRLNKSDKIKVDHKDRNIFNNSKLNLRLATQQQNVCNSKKRINNTSGYIGVHWHMLKRLWQSSIRVHGKCIILGHFKCKIEAAIKRDEAAIKYFGEFASLNFSIA